MKRLFSISIILILSAVSLSACYGNNDIKVDNKFQCKTNDDCLVDDGYVCSSTHQCILQDISKADSCDDQDGDGFGSGDTPAAGWKNCQACIDNSSNKAICTGQIYDCEPDNKNIHPSVPGNTKYRVFDYCDGHDRDCNGHDDDGVYTCADGDDPLKCGSAASVWAPEGFRNSAVYKYGCFSGRCVVFKEKSSKCYIYTCDSKNKKTLVEDSAATPCNQIKYP